MMKRILPLIIVILSVTTLLFLGLWQKEKHDVSDLRDIASSAASASLQDFKEYEETENERYYYSGVAEFSTFNTVYGQIVYDTNDSANALFCNEVYGILISDPENCMTNINRLIAAMELLSKDIDDPNAYVYMADLRYSLKE